ncbi:hypothetical protein [Brevundimonas sp. P7753]|uniref:TRADD-N-associated membrane domain-containing protein n=1 Tax=Brevundimonas sp. P7753 TaxID=2726982 RepID=UPI0015BC1997|nr:hypothetical protein [Brevundimonas sp. P7753]NWE54216.1 hypothetical protein [Brevundimonas sp. P7753]
MIDIAVRAQDWFALIAGALTAAAAIFSGYALARSYEEQRKAGINLELLFSDKPGAKNQRRSQPGSTPPSKTGDIDPPSEAFETTALRNYYKHALSRANVSFWFSMTFATIGFGVIIFAFVTHTSADIWGSALKMAGGAVIDAVAGLFFVQSTNAQKSMGEFFEKLRLDRLNAEARLLLADIEHPERRDEVRTQLVLKYSAIEKLIVSGS